MKTELLKTAYAIIDGIPAKRLDLNLIANSNDPSQCGTIACVMGFLGMHPTFQARGLETTQHNHVLYNGVKTHYAEAAMEIFSMAQHEAFNLFGGADWSERWPGKGNSRRSDKTIWKHRCRKLLEHYGAL